MEKEGGERRRGKLEGGGSGLEGGDGGWAEEG